MRFARLRLLASGVKQFSGRELLARIGARLESTRARPATDARVRESEERVRESERRFRALANTTPAIIWTAAPDGTITFASDRWFEYTGLSRENNPGPWPHIQHPDDREHGMGEYARALADGTEYEVEVRNRRHDGEYRWFLTRAIPIRNASGVIEAWFGSATDIHDRKASEAERERLLDEQRRDRDLLDRVVSNAPIAIAIVRGTELRHTLVNPTYQAIVGPDVPVLGRTFREVFPEAADRGVEEALRRVLGTGHPWHVRDLETPLPGRTGTSWWEGEVLRLPGSPDALLILTWEITDRKRIEASLREAKQAAETSNRAKDEFLAMLGHELRNPLGAIAGAVNLLDAPGVSREIAAQGRAVIGRQVQHLARLVDDLLDVSRVTSGKVVLVRRPVDLAELVTRTVSMGRSPGQLDQHQIIVDAESVWVEADETRLEQVLSNLLGNAVKYTSARGIVTIRVRDEGNVALLQVADTGAGIPPDLVGRVFDLFVQGDRTLDRAQGGLGIGLTLVKVLVEMHGGTVEAQSEGLGKGAVFTVRLPRLSIVPHAAPVVAEPASSTHIPRRIIVIEDNPDMREMLRIQLTLDGHDVRVATDGEAAVALAAAHAPDVMLVDVGLPGLDGYALARRIRATERGKMMVLIALTGYGQAEDRRRAQEAGFDVHLVKPVGPAVLRAAIAKR